MILSRILNLRTINVSELKRIMTVKHNELTTKQKKGDKKGANKTATAKPVVALARNAFMHGDNFGSHADENPDDYGPQAQRVRGGLRMPSLFALFLMIVSFVLYVYRRCYSFVRFSRSTRGRHGLFR
jgi:hypothetical protein